MLSPLLRRIQALPFLNRNRKVTDQVTLSYRRIYILPCRNGMSFGIILGVMLLGSMNYNLSLGYMLVFLLGGMATASIFHSFRNLLGIHIKVGRTEPCHAGSKAGYTLYLDSKGKRNHSGIFVIEEDGESQVLDIHGEAKTEITVHRHAPRRGMLPLGTLTLFTVYPLGLFRAWSVIEFATPCPIYPRPADTTAAPAPGSDGNSSGTSVETTRGHDDFSGLRQYHHGDSLKHVAWKAVAHGQGMMTKQFTGLGRTTSWFDWQQLEGNATEQRLSILCRWILDADAEDSEYGLRLPGLEIPPNKGTAHKQHCLTALARYQPANQQTKLI